MDTRTRQHCNYRIKFFATAILIEHKLFLYLSRLFRTTVFPPVPYHLLLGILIAGKRESLRSQFRRGMLVLYGGKFQRIRLRRVSGFEIFTSTLNRAKRGEEKWRLCNVRVYVRNEISRQWCYKFLQPSQIIASPSKLLFNMCFI